MRRIFSAVLIALAVTAVTACGRTPIGGIATRTNASHQAPTLSVLCRAWGAELPTRSRQDTAQTQLEIEAAYDAFAATCPSHADLIPGSS